MRDVVILKSYHHSRETALRVNLKAILGSTPAESFERDILSVICTYHLNITLVFVSVN